MPLRHLHPGSHREKWNGRLYSSALQSSKEEENVSSYDVFDMGSDDEDVNDVSMNS